MEQNVNSDFTIRAFFQKTARFLFFIEKKCLTLHPKQNAKGKTIFIRHKREPKRLKGSRQN